MEPGENYDFMSASEEEKDKYVEGMLYAEKLFAEEFGIMLRVAYGTLLGAIRERDFIKNDTDIDMTYLSLKNKKSEVINEMNKIYDRLIDLGLVIFDFRKRKHVPHGGQIHLYFKEYDMILDITTSWIDEEGNYWAFPFGKMLSKDDVVPFKRIYFRKIEALVPKNPEAILTFLYKDWKIPIGRGPDGKDRTGFKLEWNYGLLT